jgi:cation diffusion facilitator CzcD-associated flavoprotein CzcO
VSLHVIIMSLDVIIIGGGIGGLCLAQAIRGYQADMLRYGFQAVADSRDKPFLRMARR